MPAPVQLKMEAAFDTSFDAVEIHADSERAQALDAEAFTQGNELHFASGRYNPTTASGQALIGHELTHVIQQRARAAGSAAVAPQFKGASVNANPALEAEADELGARAARGLRVRVRTSQPGAALRRAQPRHAAPIQMKAKAWKDRLTEIISTISATDPKAAKIFRQLLNQLPDEGKAISEKMSQDGVTGRASTKSGRKTARAKQFSQHMWTNYLSLGALSTSDGANLPGFFNSARGVGTYREELIRRLLDGRVIGRSELEADNETGTNWTGTGACYQGADTTKAILNKLDIESYQIHNKSRERDMMGKRKDHMWTLLTDKRTIVDGTWKQFWKPRRDLRAEDPTPNTEDWQVLNAAPDVFVGDISALRGQVEQLNRQMGEPFSSNYIDEILSLYEIREALPLTKAEQAALMAEIDADLEE